MNTDRRSNIAEQMRKDVPDANLDLRQKSAAGGTDQKQEDDWDKKQERLHEDLRRALRSL